MAAAIVAICEHRQNSDRLARGARRWVETHASQEAARGVFRKHLGVLFPACLDWSL